MRKSTFSESQRMAILAKHDGGQSVEEICRGHQISPATFYKWKKELSVEQDCPTPRQAVPKISRES